MKTWTERIGIVVAAGVLSMMLNARSGETQQVSPRAGAVPAGGIIFQTGECWAGWAEYTPARGRYVVGLVGGGTEAGTVGTALGDRESRATGAHSHGSGTLAASYTRPTASYTRPTASYTRPTVSYRRPTARYTRPTARYTRPTVNHQHTHNFHYHAAGYPNPRNVDDGNDHPLPAFTDTIEPTAGQSAGPRVSGGGVSLTGGSVSLTGGGVSLTGGGVSLTGGRVKLRDGGVSLTGGGVSLTGATSGAGRSVAAPYIQLRACRKL